MEEVHQPVSRGMGLSEVTRVAVSELKSVRSRQAVMATQEAPAAMVAGQQWITEALVSVRQVELAPHPKGLRASPLTYPQMSPK